MYYQVQYLGNNKNGIFGSWFANVSEQELVTFVRKVCIEDNGKIIGIDLPPKPTPTIPYEPCFVCGEVTNEIQCVYGVGHYKCYCSYKR